MTLIVLSLVICFSACSPNKPGTIISENHDSDTSGLSPSKETETPALNTDISAPTQTDTSLEDQITSALEDLANETIEAVEHITATEPLVTETLEEAVEEAVSHGTVGSHPQTNSSIQSLISLLSGNGRYLSDSISPPISAALRNDLAVNGQHPYAIVITCSDSRVPAELIFDAGLGEIFVIRTAGNVVSDFEIGSVEYGAEHLGSPLVLVLGHSNCGAVTAATEGGEAGGRIQAIVNEISPAVEQARASGATEANLLNKAIEYNVLNSIARLNQSEILQELQAEGRLAIIGGVYDINTGNITILE